MRRRMWAALIAGVAAATAGCSAPTTSGSPSSASTASQKFATVGELATAMRARQAEDGSLAFSVKLLGSDEEGFSGAGSFVTRRDGTDAQEKVTTIGHTPSATRSDELVVLGPDVYVKGEESDQSWQKHTLVETGGPREGGVVGVLVADEMWFTRLDEVSEAFTLVGSSVTVTVTVASGAPAVEYRLTADYLDAVDKASERLALPPETTTPSNSAPIPLELVLTVDSGARLQKAGWSAKSGGKTTTAQYDFSNWGNAAAITAPAT